MTSDEQAALIADLQADNARLRRLLDRQDAPAELRHRLRGMVGLLRSIIRRSSQLRRGEKYASHLEERLDALMRVQGAIDLRGEVDLHTMIADELLSYAIHEEGRLRLSGPEVLLQPKAAQVMGLVVHELTINAVEHGGLVSPEGRIDAAWRLDTGEPSPSLLLTWVETGSADLERPLRSGFGTEVLVDMAQYELQAETSVEYAAAGLRYTLRLPFPQRIGRLADAP